MKESDAMKLVDRNVVVEIKGIINASCLSSKEKKRILSFIGKRGVIAQHGGWLFKIKFFNGQCERFYPEEFEIYKGDMMNKEVSVRAKDLPKEYYRTFNGVSLTKREGYLLRRVIENEIMSFRESQGDIRYNNLRPEFTEVGENYGITKEETIKSNIRSLLNVLHKLFPMGK